MLFFPTLPRLHRFVTFEKFPGSGPFRISIKRKISKTYLNGLFHLELLTLVIVTPIVTPKDGSMSCVTAVDI